MKTFCVCSAMCELCIKVYYKDSKVILLTHMFYYKLTSSLCFLTDIKDSYSFITTLLHTTTSFWRVLGQLPPRKTAPPPTLILTLTLNGGNHPRRQFFGHLLEIQNKTFNILTDFNRINAF